MQHPAYAGRRRHGSFILEALAAVVDGEPERAVCVAEDVYIPARSICRAFLDGGEELLEQLPETLTPTGHPGERVDEEGRRWYSAAFLDDVA